MQKWADNVKKVQEDGRVKLAIVAANNHYAGFGPVFRSMLGLSEAKWEEREEEQGDLYQPPDIKQRSLSDFMS